MALTGNVYESSSDTPLVQTAVSAKDESSPKNDEKSERCSLTESALKQHQNEILIKPEFSNDGGRTPTMQCDDNESTENNSSILGAGVLAGIAGLLLGGPILAAISGVGAYFVASNNDGPIGDAARQTGEWAVNTSLKVSDTAKEVDERHGVWNRVQGFFSSTWRQIRQFDQEHRASERVKETISEVSIQTVEFEKKHHVAEKILVGVQSGVTFLLEKLKCATEREGSS